MYIKIYKYTKMYDCILLTDIHICILAASVQNEALEIPNYLKLMAM